MPPATPGEKIAVIEQRLDQLDMRVARIEAKVDEMHNLLLQAKGAKWALLGVAGLAGALTAKATTWFPFLFQSHLK